MAPLILGDGLLGSELRRITGWDYVSRKNDGIDFADINTYSKYVKDYSTVVNCIAYCNTYDKSRGTHWDVNYKGVVDLVDYMRNMDQKLVHISTDYIYSNSESNASESDVPVHCENWYGYTKLLSDAYIQLKMPNYLLIRGTHKETPFEYDGAYINQIGNFDYVNEVAKIMVDLIEGEADGVYNVGTKLKTMYDLAKKTKPDVMPINEKFHYTMPSDVSMDLTKLRKFMGDDENSNWDKSPKCCHVIAFYAGPRRKDMRPWYYYPMKLLKYIYETHKKVDGGIPFDIIVVNNEYGNQQCDEFLKSIDGKSSKNGKIRVINRENLGISYGAYNAAYQKFKNEYEYWFFTEDDIILNKPLWYKDCYDELNKSLNDPTDKVAFITPNGINTDHENSHVFNGCGLTHKKYLDEIDSVEGKLPHGDFGGLDGFFPDKMVAINTEIEFTNIFLRLGYDFKDILYDEKKGIRYVDSWYTAVGKKGIRNEIN